MKILMPLAAALLAATAFTSSASADGVLGCDSSLPDGSVQADSCDVWNNNPAAAARAQQTYEYHVVPGWRGIHHRTDVHGGSGN